MSTTIPAVPCAYCRQAIPAATFVYWSRAKRLLSAECPECTRRTTVLTATWQQFNEAPRKVGQ
jgi:hypothetical protein